RSGAPPARAPSTTLSPAETVPPSSAGSAAPPSNLQTNSLSVKPRMPAPSRPTARLHFDDPLRPKNPLVARRWILGGIGVMMVASLVAIYFAIGLLFWQGQWQLIFHPSHIVTKTPASEGV